jgi:hypothetical protein
VVLRQFIHRDVDGGLVSSRLAEMVFCRSVSNGFYGKGVETPPGLIVAQSAETS